MRKPVPVLLLAGLATLATVLEPTGVQAAQIVGATSVVPGTVPVGAGTVVTVTSRIDDASLLPASVNLQRLDAAGRVLGTLGTLVDTGTGGDAVAGDKVFTVQTTIFETTPGPVMLRVSAAFAGKLLRAFSAPVTVTVAGVSTGITITSPGNLAFVNTSPVRVTGTAAAGATVAVNGVAASLSGGSFTASVPLQEGINTLTAVAANMGGTATAASVQVTLDTTPPHVTIVAPAEGYTTASATVSVSGMVNDIVVGTVNDEQAHVTVNGVMAQVANRSFLATNVPLVPGTNTLQATATDRSGNAATTQVVVSRVALQTSAVRVVSGDGQTGPVGTVLPQPLVVAVTDALGQPAGNVPVVFTVTENSGGLVSGSAQLSAVVVQTNAQGRASAQFGLGTRAGVGNNIVAATAAGYAGQALFRASGTAGGAAQIVVDTGNGQIGAVGQTLPQPFIVIVADAGHNRLPGVPVAFTMRQGGGSFGGQPYVTTTTDGDGRAAAVLTLGQQEGQDNNVVEATFAGNAGNPAAFLASGRVPGDPAQTRITGVVLDNSNHAIPGVTLRVFRTHHGPGLPEQVTTPVTTNAQGQFEILPAPVGTYKLMADGSTGTNGPWPSLEFDMTTVAGQANDVGLPIYLPALDTVNQLCVTATTGGTLTLPQVPGFALTITPGSATFPGGSRSGCVTVTPVNGDKSPMSPGFGQQPRFLVTIQPVGTVFNPPAAITLPNVDGLAPRAVTEMYSYDHDLASFVAIGTGTVSEDGLVVRSDPGVGVLKAGWHCGGNPNPTGSAATCGECAKCVGTECKADTLKDGKQCNISTTERGVCRSGYCVKDPRLEIDRPADNVRFDIDATPKMPEISAHAHILDKQPDPTSTTDFTWQTQIRYTGPNGRKLDVDLASQTVRGGGYDPVFPNIRGGNLTFIAAATVDGKSLTDKTDGVIIRGLNPSHASVNARLGGFPATNIACWESLHRLAQFTAQGLPLFGGPNGYGIMQVDNPAVSDDGIWNWQQNVDEGLAIIATKRADASGYPRRVQAQFPDATDFVALNLVDAATGQSYLDLETIQRYNGGAYWRWNDTQKKWVASPPNDYVTNVLAATDCR